ncbi:MAG TPA: hypothetical protein VM677_31915, partial [Actinokineospora sp.]|nr:hypothetical protein [Actinokineospora sp.]
MPETPQPDDATAEDQQVDGLGGEDPPAGEPPADEPAVDSPRDEDAQDGPTPAARQGHADADQPTQTPMGPMPARPMPMLTLPTRPTFFD